MKDSLKPSSKIRIFTPDYKLGDYFTYTNNQKKLNFLPTLFLFVSLAFVSLFGLSTLTAFSKQGVSSLPFSNKSSSPLNQISVDNLNLNKEIQEIKTGADVIEEEKELSQKFVLNNNLNQTCQLSYNQKTDQELKISANQQGFWEVSDCINSDLKFIQIIKIPDQITKDNLQKDSSVTFQSLDQEKNIYAVLYPKPKDEFNFNLSDFSRALAIPVFSDENWFNEATAFDTNRLGDKTYYLDQECNQISLDKKCKLWVFDNYSGKLSILFEDFRNLSSELSLDQKSVRFSREQVGFPKEISLVIFSNQKSNSVEVVKIDLLNVRLLSKNTVNIIN